ncbi:hypothetical protein D9611_012363 [Ephemerocybe angulata]|uniref:Uncharacterized protein n=1 Tax=Ephemerocybe angulata TaxID=980116 RepID=A0A8H5CE57_9AGAR|nr:hypothetical protein D9611_012363 [Tulosesus angulatus]
MVPSEHAHPSMLTVNPSQIPDSTSHEQPNAATPLAQVLRLRICVDPPFSKRTCAVAYAKDVALIAERRQERVYDVSVVAWVGRRSRRRRRTWRWVRRRGDGSPAAAPVASVTVVFAEGTGAPPSLSAEESVGMLAGPTAPPPPHPYRHLYRLANELGFIDRPAPYRDFCRSKRPSLSFALDLPVEDCKLVRVSRPLQDRRIACLEYYPPWDFAASTRQTACQKGGGGRDGWAAADDEDYGNA